MQKIDRTKVVFKDYTKTDHDATFVRMKENHLLNGQLKPGYNLQISTENQYILGYTIHQTNNDTTTFQAHMESLKIILVFI